MNDHNFGQLFYKEIHSKTSCILENIPQQLNRRVNGILQYISVIKFMHQYDKINVSLIKKVNSSEVLTKLRWYDENCYESVLILVANAEYEKFQDLIPAFSELNLTIAGGFFPNLSFEDKLYDEGALLIGISGKTRILHINTDSAKTAPNNTDANELSAIVFLDALSEDSEEHINVINNILDPNLPIIGMGVGALDFIHRPAIFTNEGLVKSSSLLVILETKIIQTTTHGYEAIAGPFLATKTEGNVTYELNYQPAFEVYLNSLVEFCDDELSQDNFFDRTQVYPLGIENSDGSFIIKNPITTDGHGFTCVGSIPQNSVVYIMRGEESKMIKSSKDAALEIYEINEAENKQSPNIVLSIGCISRKLFLGKNYEQELRAVSNIPAAVHAGVLSIGEVSNYNASNATFLNNTLVLGLF